MKEQNNTAGEKVKLTQKAAYACVSVINSLKYIFSSKTIQTGGDIYKWGEDNILPEKIYASYLNNVYHGTICNGISDMVLGDGLELSEELKAYIKNNMALEYKEGMPQNELAVNVDGDDLEDIIRESVPDYITLGTYANDLYFNYGDELAELYYLDVIKGRLLRDRNSIRFSKDGWIGSNCISDKSDIPLFDGKRKEDRQVFMHRTKNCRTVYPLPYYYAVLDNIEMDSKITEFHNNALDDGFSQFRILYYPGVASQEEADKIVANYKKNFTGTRKAGGTMFIFGDGDERPELITVPDDNFDKKFNPLEETNNTKIFAGFRAQPVLFGILTKTTGFSEQEHFEAYKLFINTLVMKIRNTIIRDYEFIFGIKKPFSFKPTPLELSINQNTQNNVS